MKWFSPYLRKLVRRMIREGRYLHKGRRYFILVDNDRGLIIINDVYSRKRYILLAKRVVKEVAHKS